MNSKAEYISYHSTGSFSKIVLDYINADKKLQPFYQHSVSIEGMKAAIAERKSYPTNRSLLVETLEKHYSKEILSSSQQINLKQLINENCFTITTAHQPNIFTGHLYFVYKILHTIKLCEKLKGEIPEQDFVPVYFMGSEDADLEELGHVYINGQKKEWKTNQTGAVGRMKVDKFLIKMLDEIAGEIEVYPHGNEIISKMKSFYTEGITIEDATFKLVNNLFAEYGLLVLLPDNADYKKAFTPVIEKELTERFSNPLVQETVSQIPKEYKVQAGGRDLNMFYLKDDSRERVLNENSKFTIQNSTIEFDEASIIKELKLHPERFSPNVILRPVFQEMILPNIAFIGGGGELAYWLELKAVFEAVKVPYPVLVLRNSFLLTDKKQRDDAKKFGFTIMDFFKTEQYLLTELVKRESAVQLSLEKEKKALSEFYRNLKSTVGFVDTTLLAHTEALEKQALKKMEALEKKMLRAEKKKFDAQQRQLSKLKAQLFPHSNLQERIENIIPLYAKWGNELIKTLYKHSLAMEQEFVLIEMGE